MAKPARQDERHPLAPSLKKLHGFLANMLELHRAAGRTVTVTVQDEPESRFVLHEVASRSGGVLIRYGRGPSPSFGLAFSEDEAPSFRYGRSGFVGRDGDGEWVQLRWSPPATAPDRPARTVRSSQSFGATIIADAPGKPLLHPAVARALVFDCSPLGRREDPREPWELGVALGSARSEQGRLWQDHRCILEYLVSTSARYGLDMIVPGPRIMTAMNMRFTKGSIEYGKAALARLRDTVVYVDTAGDNEAGPLFAQPRALRFITSFEWRTDGGVRVQLAPEAINTFRPAATRELREVLEKPDAGYWTSWLAGMVATGAPLRISRGDLEALASLAPKDTPVWSRLATVLPDAQSWELLWWDRDYASTSDVEGRMLTSRLAERIGSRKVVPTGAIVTRYEKQRERMEKHLKAGAFVADRSQTVAWRIVDDDILEIVPFDRSGMHKLTREEQRAASRHA